MSNVYEAIKILDSIEERTALRVYFTNNPEKRAEAESFLSICVNNKEIVAYFKGLLKPASVENLANLFGQMDVSSSSSSPSLSMFLKVVVDNSEIMRKNSEIMVQFMKEWRRTDHDTAYQDIKFEKVDVEHFLEKNETFLDEFKSGGSVNVYLQKYPVPTDTEDKVQDWFNGLMKTLPKFGKRLVIKDTHNITYLSGLKPDLSVFLEEDVVNDVYLTMHVQTLLEVKKRKNMSGLSNEDKGQVLDYIRILVQQQPLREFFAVFLSDGFYFYVMAYDRRTRKYSEYTTHLKTGLRLFWVLLNFSSPFTTMVGPKSINFITSQGTSKIRLKEHLGVGSSSTVYIIDWENTPSAIKVLKSGYDPLCEVQVLRFLNKEKFPNVPVYVVHDDNSLIIRPVCKRIDDGFLASHALQLLHLLKRIHNLNIYHRDVRPENILLDTDNNIPILVDWGSSIQYPKHRNDEVPYEGTITFASPDILTNDFDYYKPKASDDLHSFIRTIYILRNPSNMPTIPNGDFSLKAQAIREYWSDKLDGRLWKEMVDAASEENYDLLEKCCYVFKK